LIVDYPPEEVEQFGQMLDKAQIAPIFLLAPTSTQERVAAVGKVARGYVYYVSLRGITGAANIDTEDVARQVRRIREHVSIPIGVGFGISDEASASKVARVADAVVIGSKLISVMNQACEGLEPAKQTDAAVKAGHDWLAGIRRAIEQVDKRSAEQTA